MKTKYRVRYCSDPQCSCKMPRRGKLYRHINKRVRIRINKYVLVTIVILLLIAAFVSSKTIQDKTQRQNQLRNQIHELEIKQSQEIQKINADKQQELDKTKQDYDKKIEELNKQLQAKKEEKARQTAVLASQTRAISKPVYSTNCESYRSLVSQYAWNTDIAMAIMRAESGCNPMAANLTDSHSTCKGSFGLFQIACFDGQVYDPAQNVAIAYRKYKASGWKPWGVYTSGAYLKYL